MHSIWTGHAGSQKLMPVSIEMMWFLQLGNRPVSNLIKKLQIAKVCEGSAKRNAKLIFLERPG